MTDREAAERIVDALLNDCFKGMTKRELCLSVGRGPVGPARSRHGEPSVTDRPMTTEGRHAAASADGAPPQAPAGPGQPHGEKPILFSGEMVRALLDGRKTQTRRVCKPEHFHGSVLPPDTALRRAIEYGARSPFGTPGGRLWVRENFWMAEAVGRGVGVPFLYYDADQDFAKTGGEPREPHDWMGWMFKRWGRHPSIHMPHWASRITLELTAVRVERLQDISEDDAFAEGIEPSPEAERFASASPASAARIEFAALWDRINGKREKGALSWEHNPWVWALTFRRVKP